MLRFRKVHNNVLFYSTGFYDLQILRTDRIKEVADSNFGIAPV